MADPTVVCRSCGVSASHAPGNPMALCPFCGAPLPITLDVREARDAEERARVAELVNVRRPEPLWVPEQELARRRRGWWLWLLLLLAAGAAAWAWSQGGSLLR